MPAYKLHEVTAIKDGECYDLRFTLTDPVGGWEKFIQLRFNVGATPAQVVGGLEHMLRMAKEV